MVVIITEIILFAFRRLRPLTYLVMQVFKTTLWVALFCMSIVVIGRGMRYSTYSAQIFLGLVQVVVVLLSFVGTLIYAAVIYHRHRLQLPYHRSEWGSTSSPDTDRYKNPFSNSEIGTVSYGDRTSIGLHNRDSAAAPDFDRNGSKGTKNVGELDNDAEIREICSPNRDDYEKNKWRRDGKPRELEGDPWVYELSAERSVKGSRRATAQTDGGRKVERT
ncbi:MAG: hypothetical protein Q9166_006023 [cf. Caloplaca sp. 2 TL-2023]